MRQVGTFAPYIAIAVAVAVPLNLVVGAEGLRRPNPVTGIPGIPVQQQLARVDTADRRHPCDHGFFGSPPAFEPASINKVPQTAFCDRTQYVEAFLCVNGVTGAQATSPVLLGVTYDSLLSTAHVVDGDSTPEQNDVVSVTATVFANQPPDPRSAMPMLDDGSLTTLPNIFNGVQSCTEDPVAGVCSCVLQNVPAYSGDVAIGDGIYTLESPLVSPTFPLLLEDVRLGCIIQNRSRNTLFFHPGVPVSVILRATDRVGNVVSTTATVTPSATTSSCTGDACGCCLLVSTDPVNECAGLPGMPSPDYPNGICQTF